MRLHVWAKVASVMLARAGDEFGNHGCNDMNLDELGLTRDQQIELVTAMHEFNGDPEEIPQSIRSLPHTSDFCVMFACAAYFRRIALQPAESSSQEGGK